MSDQGQLENLSTTDSPVPVYQLNVHSGAEGMFVGDGTTFHIINGKIGCAGGCLTNPGVGSSGITSAVHTGDADDQYACVVLVGGRIECWGTDNQWGELGGGDEKDPYSTNFAPVYVVGFGACIPDCSGKTCGPDGCGGQCGTCTYGTCSSQGQCVCTPSCGSNTCGGDGCGGSCGSCSTGQLCHNGTCGCDPVNDTGCTSPNECWVLSTEATTCGPPGVGTQGSVCATTSDCAGGYACFASTCRKICNILTNTGCPTGLTCAQVSGWQYYGTCA